MSAPTTNVASQILAHLASKSLSPTTQWLTTFLSNQRPTVPIAALKQTAVFRLLASDITDSLQSAANCTFPPDILNAQIQERRLKGPIPVQVLDMEDIGRSRWSQIEAIEAAERGETTKGREVIRVVDGEEGLLNPESAAGGGPHRLLLQDAKGVRIYGFELVSVDGIGLKMSIGTKIVLKDATVARGVVLLEPASTTVIGGKIEGLHKAWKEGRKAELRRMVGAPDGE